MVAGESPSTTFHSVHETPATHLDNRLAVRHAGRMDKNEYLAQFDVTDRTLWYEAISMAASEGVLGSFVAGDPYVIRDRMMDEYDRLRALDS